MKQSHDNVCEGDDCLGSFSSLMKKLVWSSPVKQKPSSVSIYWF